MIAKELDAFESQHEYEQAGQVALERVAQVLKTAFGGRSAVRGVEVIVLNGLRLELPEQVAHLDHLILHLHGFILIENRSRRADLEVSALGEWTQTYREAVLRIPSPTQQAERKLSFLQRYLTSQNLPQGLIEGVAYDHVVSIPDEGEFTTPQGITLANVSRARDLPAHIGNTVQSYVRGGGLFRGRGEHAALSRDDMLKLSVLLRQNHRPLEGATRLPQRVTASATNLGIPKVRVSKPTTTTSRNLNNTCSKCGEPQLRVSHHGGEYQFECRGCETYTLIDRRCSTCSSRRYVRQSGSEFFIECERCLTSRLLHINPTS